MSNFKTKKIVIDDFSKTNLKGKQLDSQALPIRLYNFKHSDGILERGMGMTWLMTYAENDKNSLYYTIDFSKINLEYYNKVMYFKQYFETSGDTTHRLLIHGSDNKLYIFEMFSQVLRPNWAYELTFDTVPIVLEYKKNGLDSILISASNKLVVWSTGKTPYEISNVPTITSMCIYNDVLYCTIEDDDEKIWYTTNLNPETVGTESTETKFLIMDGNAGGGRKIVIIKENVYVFCDYGIGRINTYVKVDNCTYNEIYLTNGKIYPNTIVVCGDFAVFMTEDGLYKFNGSSVTKIDAMQNLLQGSVKDFATATSLRNDYYLAIKIDFGGMYIVGSEEDDYKNNALVKLDLNDYSFEIMRGVDIKDMLALKAGVEEKIIVTFNSIHKEKIGEITSDGICFDTILDRHWESNVIMQPNMSTMTIRNIRIDASEGVSFVIRYDNKMKVFNTKKDGINEFQTLTQCQKFTFEITSNNQNAYVNHIELEYIVRE